MYEEVLFSIVGIAAFGLFCWALWVLKQVYFAWKATA